MSNIIPKSLVLLLCLSLALATQCPLDVQSSQFVTITGDSQTVNSEFLDAFYEIKLNSVSSTYTLTGYKLTELSNVANSGFDAQEFTLSAKATWKILAVSQLGNCLLIDDRPNVIAYETSQTTFTLKQNITQASFVSGKVNDDCSIVRLTLQDSTEKVFINSNLDSKLVFPTGSIFDAYFIYGIDSTGSLKKVSQSTISTVDIGSSVFKSNPISIFNQKDSNYLVVVTSNAGKTEYAVTIVNTLIDSNAFSKNWAAGSFSGEFKVEIGMDGDFVVIRDGNGYLKVLEIIYTETATTAITVIEVDLEKEEYKSLFGPDSVVSTTENSIVVYLNGKLTYFQPSEGYLYYLAQIVEDLELEAIKYANATQEDLTFTTTYFYADQMGTCNVFPSDTTDESQLEDDSTSSDVVDDNGNFIRCDDECLTCTAQGICKVCALGYSLSADGECILCDGCKSCTIDDPSLCTSCFKPLVLNISSKLCEKPACADSNCIDCNSAGQCLQCYDEYSPYNGVCVKCQEGCTSCKKGGEGTCDDTSELCNEGFVYFPSVSRSVKYTCVECAAGCVSCSTSDLTSCTACNEGYFPTVDENNDTTCTECFANCLTCTNAQSCSKCDAGFRLNSDKTKCIPKCDDSCLTCSETTTTECLTCYVGSKLVGSQCVADLACNTNKSCVSCGSGFTLKAGECLQCDTGVDKCVGCASANLKSCTACASGYYINENRQCKKCSSQCATCRNQDACVTCADGYFISKPSLSATGRCLPCRSTCQTCSFNSFLCTSCPTGFTLEGKKCINEKRVDYVATVSSDVAYVAVLARTFFAVLIETAQKSSIDPENPLKLSTSDIHLKKIKKGSAILQGTMSSPSDDQSNVLASRLSSDLSGLPLEDGYYIIGVQVSAVVTTVKSSTDSSSNLGLILGVAIPIFIIVVIGVILIIYRLRQRKQDMESDKYSTNSGYFVNESQKYVAKFSEVSDKV